MKQKLLVGLMVITGMLLSSCNLFNSGLELKFNFKSTGVKNSLKLKTYSLEPQGLKTAGVEVSGTGEGLLEGQQISFTPTSVKFTFSYIAISEAVNSEGNTVYDDPTKLYYEVVSGVSTTIDVASSNQENLYTVSSTIPPERYGNYIAVKLLYEQILKVSGSVTVNGKTYSFTDIEVPAGNIPNIFIRSTPFTIDEANPPNIQLYFDVQGAATLTSSSNGVVVPIVPNEAYLSMEGISILPYAGNETPTVNKYVVQIQTNFFTWGDHTKFGLKIITLSESDGYLAGISWQPVFFEGYSGIGFAPAMLFYPSITKNEDGSWYIKNHVDDGTAVPESRVVFPSFKLEEHSGVFYYGVSNQNIPVTNHPYTCSNL